MSTVTNKVTIMCLVSLVFFLGLVVANSNCVPNMYSNEYHGTALVKFNGEYIPLTGNHTLLAVVDDDIVGSTKIKSDGGYAIDVSPCPGTKAGEEIYFFIGDVEALESKDNLYKVSPIESGLDLHFNKYPNAVCGNEEINKGEECDDGNTDAGDGCSEICEVELGYECELGAPSVCRVLEFCGDSVCNTGETCSSCSVDCGACPISPASSGASSGGSGGGSSTPKKNLTVLCEEDWSCTEWSECDSDLQSRDCEDLNACGTEKNKPQEQSTCEKASTTNEDEENEPKGFKNLFTTAAIGGSAGIVVGAVIIIVLAVVSLFMLSKKKE